LISNLYLHTEFVLPPFCYLTFQRTVSSATVAQSFRTLHEVALVSLPCLKLKWPSCWSYCW